MFHVMLEQSRPISFTVLVGSYLCSFLVYFVLLASMFCQFLLFVVSYLFPPARQIQVDVAKGL